MYITAFWLQVEISRTDSGSEVKSYLVRLLTYFLGRPIAEIPIGPQLLYEIGKLAAKLDKTLEKFYHPKISSLHRENFIWNLKSVPLLEKYLYALGQNQNREIVEQVIQLFKDEVMTNLSHFRECEYPPNQVNVFLNFSVVKFQTSRKVWRYNLALTILILCHIWSCCF